MSSIDVPITILYRREVKYFLNTVLRLVTLQMIFNLNTTNFYLQGYSGNIYCPNIEGEFVDIKEKILIIQPFSDQVKLETMRINNTDARFLFIGGDWTTTYQDYLSTGYSLFHKNPRKTFIKFDNLEGLDGKKIVKAYLRLHGGTRDGYYSDEPNEVFVYRIEQKYENIVSCEEIPAYNPEPCASIIIGKYDQEEISWDITSLFKGWIDKTYPNYGLLLMQPDLYDKESCKMYYRSNKPPYLNIIYIAGQIYKPKLN